MGLDICAKSVLDALTLCCNGVAMKNIVRLKQCLAYLDSDLHLIVVVGGSFVLSP